MILRQLLDQVKIENIAGDQINPATSENIAELETLLTNIYDAVDGLELSVDNIDINTDELEAKVQSVRDQLDVVLSSRVSEATGQAILQALGEVSGTNLLTELQSIVTLLGSGDLATETTLKEVRDYLDTVETKLQSLIDRFDVNLSTRASESTLTEVRDTIGQESGQTVLSKLEALKTALDTLEITVDTNTDELEAKVQAVRDQLDVLLSTRSSEATLLSVLNAIGEASGKTLLSNLDTVIAYLTSLDGKDFATETTLSTVASYLDTVETKLQALIDTDFATETTLSSVLSQLDITLSALRDAIKGTSNKDLSTLEEDIEAILAKLNVDLSTRASEATLMELLNAFGQESGTSLLAELQSILGQLDVALSTRASEATLIQVRDYLDTVETKLQTLIDKDFATEATSTEILNTIGQESGSTVLSKLQDIWDKLTSLFTDGLAKFKLWDGTSIASITADGRVKIDTAPPDAPPATTAVKVTEYSNVSSSDDDVYVIPNGETLVIQRFSAGAEVDSTAGSVIELWDDPNGDGTGMTIIDTIFSAGTSDQHDLREEIIGDGTQAIRMRRLRLTGGAKLIFGRWEGYY